MALTASFNLMAVLFVWLNILLQLVLCLKPSACKSGVVARRPDTVRGVCQMLYGSLTVSGPLLRTMKDITSNVLSMLTAAEVHKRPATQTDLMAHLYPLLVLRPHVRMNTRV